MNRFSALPSLTWPSAVRTIASSKPFSCASLLASAPFTYAPVILPRAGMALSSVRRQVLTWARMPPSVSMYWPNGTPKMVMSASRLWSRTPIVSELL